jgi:hypothetical protein
MTRAAEVRLHWLIGINASNYSPHGQLFSLPARFDHQQEDWPDDAWGLVVEVTGIPDSKGDQVGIARFLMADAPLAWLSVGRKFTLFEGHLAVVQGEVWKIIATQT